MIECYPPEAPFNHFLTTSAVANFVLNEFFFDYSGIFSFYDCQKKFLKETCQINVCSCKYSLTFRARVVRVNFRTDRFNESTALARKKNSAVYDNFSPRIQNNITKDCILLYSLFFD